MRLEPKGMQKNKPLKLVIDTNIWISFIISKSLHKLEDILHHKNTRILFSSELLQELEATITKPKLQKYFNNNALSDMLTVFDLYIDFVNVSSEITVCRDLKDDFLLALAKDGNANYLITGDKDLLELGCFENTIIIKIADFLMENGV